MRLVVQRAKSARVEVEGAEIARVGVSLVVFVGIEGGDDELIFEKAARKLAALRVWNDEDGRMTHDLERAGGHMLLISNFTLCADLSRGNRPFFGAAAAPEAARAGFERLFAHLQEKGVRVQRGVFGADMTVLVENDGPVTLTLDF